MVRIYYVVMYVCSLVTSSMNKDKEVTSPHRSLCPAKWLHVSIKLQNGHNHSCHYPPTHQVSLSELNDSLHSFHHSDYKEKQRSKMRKGSRPKECSYCWTLEDKKQASPRLDYLKRYDHFHEYESKPHPKYLEVSLSHRCQLKCSYCNPQTSHSIAEEYQRYGPYLFEDHEIIDESKHQEYRKLFWGWFKDIYFSLEDLRLTGGEPFLSLDCLDVLAFIELHPHPSLKLSFNSNLSLPISTVKKITEKVNKLIKNNKIASCTFFTSMDSWGEQACYIRFGLDLDKWQKSVSYILDNTESDIVIMNTFNILSIPGTARLVKEVLAYRTKRVKLSFSKLVFPHYLSVTYASQKELDLLKEQQKIVMSFEGGVGYVRALEEVIHFIEDEISRKSFKRAFARDHLRHFLLEYDRRKHSDFSKTFPEMSYLLVKGSWGLSILASLLRKVLMHIRSAFPKVTKKLYY